MVLAGCGMESDPGQAYSTNQTAESSPDIAGGAPAGFGSPEQKRLQEALDAQSALIDQGAKVPDKYVNEDGMISVLDEAYWTWPNGR